MVPDLWRQIVLSQEPTNRLEIALATWNEGFFDLVPQFAVALKTRFIDARVCIVEGCAALVYIAGLEGDQLVSWVGYDPYTFERPVFWESFPGPLQFFMHNVHAGFVSADPLWFGVARPKHMETIAQLAGSPDGLPEWDKGATIPSTRLLRITTDGGALHYCMSPDLAVGEIALVYEGDIDPKNLGFELDKLLMLRFEIDS